MSKRQTWRLWGIVATFVLGFGDLALAQHERVLESTRFMGRGNTYVAAPDSDEATRGNVATLAEGDVTFQIRWGQLDFFVGENALNTISDLTQISPEDSAIDILNQFRDKFGKRQYGRVQFSPMSMRLFMFEISPFVSSSNFVDMRLPTTPQVEFRSDTIIGANIAMALPIGKTARVGLTLRPANRTTYTGDLSFTTLMDFIDNEDFELSDVFKTRSGVILGLDLGGIWQPTPAWRFGALIENLGYAGHTGDAGEKPEAVPQRVNLGMQYRWDLKPWHWDFLVDLQDMLNPHGLHPLQLLHLGTEFGRSLFTRDHDLGVQAGLNEGYFTMGAFIDFWVARFNLGYYAVELGEYPGQRKDRRWTMNLLVTTTF